MSWAYAHAGTPTAVLTEETAYGRLPFDYFALKHWDYTKPIPEDQQQWNELAKRWLSMKNTSREPYEEAASNSWQVPENNPRMPIQDQINRVLVPHQTVQERNLADPRGDCAWLRTCYEPTLAPAYEKLTEWYLGTHGHPERKYILDNEGLYGNLAGGFGALFLRVPQLPVSRSGLDDEDLGEDWPEDATRLPLYTAMMNERLLLYVLDAEALQKKMIKLGWFSLEGELLWWNWLKPSDLQSWDGLLHGRGFRLSWIYEAGSDGYERYLQKGCLIEID